METRKKRHNFSLPEKRRLPAILGWASLLICLNLMLASCWVVFNDDPTGQSEAVSSPTPKRSTAATRTPSATATRTPRATPTARPTPTPTVTPSPTPAVTAAQLDAVALTAADLSSGWETSDAVDLGADREDSICNAPGPDTLIEPVARAEVQYQQSDFGPFLLENISAYGSTADARRIMDHLRSTIDCQEWDDTRNDRVWEVSPLSFPEKGDDTFSIELQTDLGFVGAVRFHAVFVRTGSVVTLIGHGTLGDVDRDDTEAFVDLALDKLDDLD